MYKIGSIMCFLIRQFCLPNPFECFGDSAVVINLIAGLILAPITYLIVGVLYDKGSEPVVGSILYLIVYMILTAVLWVMGVFSFAWWWIVTLVIVSIAMMIGVKIISEKLECIRK